MEVEVSEVSDLSLFLGSVMRTREVSCCHETDRVCHSHPTHHPECLGESMSRSHRSKSSDSHNFMFRDCTVLLLLQLQRRRMGNTDE